MRILLKLELACDADAAWRALHSMRAVAELYAPIWQVDPLTDPPPSSLTPGIDLPVRMSIGGMGVGTHLIHVSDRTVAEPGGEVRILRDSGIPLTGPLALLDVWDHQMAVSPVPGDPTRTLWRDRLVIGGPGAVLLWPVLWAVWQWRALRLRTLARTWAFDLPEAQPGPHDSDPTK